MKLKTVFLAAVCAVGLSCLAATNIESGVTIVITDATVADYAGGINFVDATGVVEFNTSSAPTMDITGAGTVKKTSASDWTMSTPISNFTGDYVLEGGGLAKVTSNTKGYFGSDAAADATAGGCLYVKDGNTLDVVNIDNASWGNWTVLSYRRVHIAGTGADGAGAIRTCYRYSTQGVVNRIICDADATYNMTSGYYIQLSGGYLDTQSYTLTFIGSGNYMIVGDDSSGQIRGSGKIRTLQQNGKKPEFCLRDKGERLYTGSTTELEIGDGTTLNMMATGLASPVDTYDGAVRFSGANSYLKTCDQYSDMKYSVWSVTNRMALAGPVTLGTPAEHTTLKLWSTLWNWPITILGNISGNGSILTSRDTYRYGRVQLMGDNTYTGSTFIDNIATYPAHFLAFKPTSLPNYSSVTCSYNNISVALNDEGTLWTPSKIAELANEATFLNGAWVGLDTTWATNAVEIALSDDLTLDSACVGGVGPHDVEFVAPRLTPVNLAAAGAVTRVKGPGEFRVGAIRISQAVPTNAVSVLEFSGGVKAVACDQPMYIGVQNQTGEALPCMRIKDASFVNTNLDTSVYGTTFRDAIVVGNKVSGILEVGEGAVVSNRILVGGTSYGVGGGVFQTGGAVTMLAGQLGHSVNDAVNMGYYELAGGTLKNVGGMAVGGNNLGYLYQTGGTATFASLGIAQAYWGYGGVYSVHGGKTVITGTGYCLGMNGCNGYDGSPIGLTVAGEGAVFSGTNVWTEVNGNKDICWVNLLDGGTLELWGLRRNADANGGAFTFNFGGGTYRVTSKNFDPFSYGVSGNAKCYPDHVYVYNGGATIDTLYDSQTRKAIESAGGTGVLSIPWTDTTTVCVFRPIVVIEGDGIGATAEAEYDSVNHVITGIRVLTQGTGYTYAKAKLRSYRNAVLATVDCTIGDYTSNGDFTKTGAGTFTIGATNSWKGATTVAGGTLKVGCDWAIPEGTALVLAGGDLDFNGKTGEVASVTYGAGGGRILNASSAVIPATSVCTISTAELAAGKTVALAGDVDLSKVTVRVTGDVSALAAGGHYDVVTTTGAFTGTPTIELDPSIVSPWRTRLQAARLRLVFPTGVVEVLR